jgi:hypothetical protein
MKLVKMQIRNGNKQLMRDINKSKILNLVRTKGPISRVAIAKELSLSQATVTYITEELISSKFVVEEGELKSTGGRKAKLLRLNDEIGVIASVICGTSHLPMTSSKKRLKLENRRLRTLQADYKAC